MPELNKHITIPKKVASGDDLDFHFLRKAGISYLEELGGSLWTDFNSHDPGTTILEMLAYALTDLGLRIETPMENLLSSESGPNGFKDQFFKASKIFPSKAVTALDYRKLFIDLVGVKNCWLRKHNKTVHVDCKNDLLSYNEEDFSETLPEFKKTFTLRGLYDIIIDFEVSYLESLDMELEAAKEEVISAVRSKYHENRNLCEDLINIVEVTEQEVSICADIELDPNVDEEWVHAKVLNAIANYFSPSLRFYSIKEMLQKGYSTNQIFDGPFLDNGFLDTEELRTAELREQVRLSDVMNIIMDIEGVVLIRDISIGHCDGSTPDNEWVICIEADKKPTLCELSAFSYHKGVLPLNINESQVEVYLEQLKVEADAQKLIAKSDRHLSLPKGSYSATSSYTTIQNDFPDTYGIGQSGIPGVVNTKRKSQAKQLKGYLLFFDQILASYFQHLSKVKDLLAVKGTERRTYFTQAIKDVKGLEEIVKAYPPNDDGLTLELFGQLDNNIERRNQILDHLLARFAERFGEYTFVMKTLYGSAADLVVLGHKEAFLSEYPEISAKRGCAFNYFNQIPEALWNAKNVSGLQRRVSRLVGVKNYNRRNLHSSFITLEKIVIAADNIRYGWHIKNKDGVIILSYNNDHPNRDLAANEAYFAILQLIQTPLRNIEIALDSEDEVSDLMIVGNLLVQKPASNNFSFNVINPELLATDENYVVGVHSETYISQGELLNAIKIIDAFAEEDFTEEGMFLVEHMLLRPDISLEAASPSPIFMPICTDDCENCDPIDPYSYRVSIVLPGFTFRFSNPDFRNHMETIIKEELPSHILPRICWVGYRQGKVPDEENDLFNFDTAWKDYLLAKTNLSQAQPEPEIEKLIEALSKLNTIYPEGQLLDCDDEGDGLTGRIILGRSYLGTIKNKEDDD